MIENLQKHLNRLAPPLTNEQAALENSEAKNYAHVELDEEELEEALRVAREAKHYRQVREEYSRKLREEPQVLSFTAEELFERYSATLNEDGKPFGQCMSPEFEAIVKRICCYFANDARFEMYADMKLRKGLLLCGGKGIGKTTLLKFFRRNAVASFKVTSCRDVEADFSIDGDEALREYSGNLKIAMNSDPFGHKQIGYCFDDLGTEDQSKHYGRIKNVMETVILNRYDMGLPFKTTHITTNLDAQGLRDRYDGRAIDRMREMFNIIDFPATEKSRRK